MLILGIDIAFYIVAAVFLLIGLVFGFMAGRDNGAADTDLVIYYLLSQKEKRDKKDARYARMISLLRNLRDGSE